MELDSGLVGQVHQCRGVVAHHVTDRTRSRASREVNQAQPVHGLAGGVLLDEAFRVDPVRVAAQCERSPGEVGQYHIGDGLVVFDHVAFGDLVVGVERFVQLGHWDVSVRGSDGLGGHDYLRTRPRKPGNRG